MICVWSVIYSVLSAHPTIKVPSAEWLTNHYAHIVVKVAAYEQHFPAFMANHQLTPSRLTNQLRARYDAEIVDKLR